MSYTDADGDDVDLDDDDSLSQSVDDACGATANAVLGFASSACVTRTAVRRITWLRCR